MRNNSSLFAVYIGYFPSSGLRKSVRIASLFMEMEFSKMKEFYWVETCFLAPWKSFIWQDVFSHCETLWYLGPWDCAAKTEGTGCQLMPTAFGSRKTWRMRSFTIVNNTLDAFQLLQSISAVFLLSQGNQVAYLVLEIWTWRWWDVLTIHGSQREPAVVKRCAAPAARPEPEGTGEPFRRVTCLAAVAWEAYLTAMTFFW